MGRSGYSDDCDDEYPVALYRQAVHRAKTGYRGQHLLCRLRDALDAMPRKRLITNAIRDEAGDVCALGALDPTAPQYDEEAFDDWGHSLELAQHFGVAQALAAEIVYMNDEFDSWRTREESPEQRWVRMRAWVDSQIAKPQADDEAQPAETPEA